MSKQAGEYAGRTVVISGGGSGLGAAMADRFAGAGAAIVLLDIDGEAAQTKAAQLRAGGTEAVAMSCDVSQSEQLADAARKVHDAFGGIHVICANVAVQQFGAVDKLTRADWQWVMDVNVHGTIELVAQFLPLLRMAENDGQRHIVLTSSSSFFTNGVRMSAYVASKYAITGYGEVLRSELAAEGINVSLLFPAGMMTRHLESSAAARPAEIGAWQFDRTDLEAMMADSKMEAATHVATAEHAARNLLTDLRNHERYIITHGDYRESIKQRQEAALAAFDRSKT